MASEQIEAVCGTNDALARERLRRYGMVGQDAGDGERAG